MDDAHMLIPLPTGGFVDAPQAFLELEGFTVGYWKCIAAMIGFTIFWRVLSLIVLICMIRKTQ